ncbi:unnamed protein product, partial [marine sediment metagenome]
MKNKKLLTIILLSLSFCFASGAGYGEVKNYTAEEFYIIFDLNKGKVPYALSLDITFYYDLDGGYRKFFPEGVDTKGKIIVFIYDTKNYEKKNVFSDKPGIALLNQFEEKLEFIYPCVQFVATNMNTDIVAKFYSNKGIPLGYFYQGE